MELARWSSGNKEQRDVINMPGLNAVTKQRWDSMTQPTSEKSPLRVIQWGTGAVGLHSLRQVIASDDLDLVAVKCFTAAKEGVDAGELAGVSAVGIKATQDVETLLALEADCVLFMPRDNIADPTVNGSPSRRWFDDVLQILASGKNVVSPIQAGTHWRHLANGGWFFDELNRACTVGGASILFTGIDPGFISDSLAISMTSTVGKIQQVRSFEVLDYETYETPETIDFLGFGCPPDALTDNTIESVLPGWGGSLWLMAEALGCSIDQLTLETETWVSPSSYTTSGGIKVAAGTVGARQWTLKGFVGAEPRFSINHVSRAGVHMAPDWLRIGQHGGYAIEIDAFPSFRGEFPLGLPGGTGSSLEDAIAMTAARCVNSMAAVVAAPPGHRTPNDLPLIGGRFGLR